ncbi:MAG TPA: hypothetical protein PK299_01305 [Anaerolineales bacterium]|nr:hypothetical protein [Anaerolineales bacterium]
MNRKRRILLFLAIAGLIALVSQASHLSLWAMEQTGERAVSGQVLGLADRAGDLLRPPLQLAQTADIPLAQVNPFGVNTFLEQEAEPAKRDQQMQMISQAGFRWIRQEFPWYDIEIHGKGDFEDRRHEPYRNAWDKYDHIVALSQQYNVQIIARLSATPAWSHPLVAGDFAPPDHFQDYFDYVAAVASRYRGQVNHFQVWNEPNIYPEWGEQDVNPEVFTELLCGAYRAIKQANPDAIVLAPALSPTVELWGRNLNEFIFLQRMYAAGAKDCFDVLSAQGYGLFSGPEDQRHNPQKINVSRHLFLRDLMVQNGDAHKAIWISEMNWNAIPPELFAQTGAPFGKVTLAEQAQFVPQLYQRAEAEWNWVGVICVWFFKRAADYEKDQPFYYFRMVEPDFTPLPLYDAMKAYTAQWQSNQP